MGFTHRTAASRPVDVLRDITGVVLAVLAVVLH